MSRRKRKRRSRESSYSNADLITEEFVASESNSTKLPDIDFSDEYQKITIPGVYEMHWKSFPSYITKSYIQLVQDELIKQTTPDDYPEEEKIISAIYLYPPQPKIWRRLKKYNELTLNSLAEKLDLSKTELLEVAKSTHEITSNLILDQGEISTTTEELIKEYILYSPAYKFWQNIIWTAHEVIDHILSKYSLNQKYFKARDYFLGYNCEDFQSLNIASFVTYDPDNSIRMYSDYLACDSPNHRLLLRFFKRSISLPSCLPETKKYIIGPYSEIVGQISWTGYTPHPTDTFEWLKLAWQFGENKEKTAGFLAFCAYNAEEYQIAIPLLEYVYITAKNPEDRWKAALKLILYYTEVEKDVDKSLIWTQNAEKINPDGQAYDLLAMKTMIGLDDPEKAIKYQLQAIMADQSESRQQAAMGILVNILDKWPIVTSHGTFTDEMIRMIERVSEATPLFSEFLENEVRDQLLKSLKEKETKSNELIENISQLEDALNTYRGMFDNGENDELEKRIIQLSGELIPENHKMRNLIFIQTSKTYPQALDSVKETLIDAFMVYSLLNQAEFELSDWSAPLIYLAKAVENQLRTQLDDMPEFKMKRPGLFKLETFIVENANRISEYFEIQDENKLSAYKDSLTVFRKSYRNGFIHKDQMNKKTLEEIFQFLQEKSIFSLFRLM